MPGDRMEPMGIALEPQEDLLHTYEFTRKTGDSCDLIGFSNPISLCGMENQEFKEKAGFALKGLLKKAFLLTIDAGKFHAPGISCKKKATHRLLRTATALPSI